MPNNLKKILQTALAISLALGLGPLALVGMQDYDRSGICLPQHIWFMLIIVVSVSLLFGWLCKRSFFGAVWGAILAINLQFLFMVNYTMGYAYWEPRPDSEKVSQEIIGPQLNGETFNINNSHAKILLVDYWATWCRPCVAGISHVREVWDKDHDRGLDVVGVSLDQKRETLQNFAEKNKLTYPQIFFDAAGQSGYNNPLAAKYGVVSIPHAILVEPKSKMVLSVVPNGRDLKWTIEAALRALDDHAAVDKLDMTKVRLATFSVLPYLFGMAGGLLGALGEMLLWRRISVPPRPKLRRIK